VIRWDKLLHEAAVWKELKWRKKLR
jgi:hypothetical protein